ncbi:hypothetical protein [Endozoicomonas sp. SCSIO W0465]|uniref:hypothetical protein n=1 Tax=Endozoicomonas sp. SCSIO W0465 TaxID=2918516 RepID=UPI0035327F82
MNSSFPGLHTNSPRNLTHFPLGLTTGLPTGLPTNELSGIYETTSYKSFRCSIADVDKVNRLFCSKNCTGQKRIMEGRPEKVSVFEANRGIFYCNLEAENHPSLLHDLGGAQDASCKSCVPVSNLYSGYIEHLELTRLAQGLRVHCAKKSASDGDAVGSGPECGAVVLLSELPDHYQAAHTRIFRPGVLAAPYRADDLPMVGQRSQAWSLFSAPVAPEQTGAAAIGPGGQDRFADVTAIKNGIKGMVSSMEAFKTLIGESVQRQDAEMSAYKHQQTNVQSSLNQLIGAMPDYVRRIEELEHTVKQLSIKSGQPNLKINALEEQLRLNANGTFVWKLEGLDNAVNEIVAGGKPRFLLSDSFHTAPKNGYKLRAKLYPCGDGIGLGTHVSLFIQVMKGEDDDHVAWPMQKKVIFEVLDRDFVPYEGCSDVFITNPDSESFQKPESEENIAAGCPVFLLMSKVHDLLHEDRCLYIRVKVEDSI